MVKAGLRRAGADTPEAAFTVGIDDDVTHLSLPTTDDVRAPAAGRRGAGDVLRARRRRHRRRQQGSVKIIGEHTDLFAQGYFVYDSKKSGSVTVSHLRFGPEPIRSTYLIEDADFVACHQFGLLEQDAVLDAAKPGATFLLNSPYGPDEVWDHLPREVQRQIIDKRPRRSGSIDADRVARTTGMGNRINTVMQPCFFAARRGAARRRGDRAHQGVGRAGLRPARRRRSSSATSRPSTPRSPPCTGRRPAGGDARRARDGVRARRRARLRHAGHRRG